MWDRQVTVVYILDRQHIAYRSIEKTWVRSIGTSIIGLGDKDCV